MSSDHESSTHGSSPRRANRLAAEKSPYLLQHAYNPVDWYPWGEDAFDRARAEDKPIFLSIGYSTCHWCHVMERESFEDPSIAELMNELYVNIKVDREERPDVDRMYMSTVQALTGRGGWPLSVWLTPDLAPYYGGTYFPPQPRHGQPGFPQLLERLYQAWREQRGQVVDSGRKLVEALRSQSRLPPADRQRLSTRPLDAALEHFRETWDRPHGGFGSAPKFPRPSVFDFLLRHHLRTGNDEALEMTADTLRKMWAGGVYDHLGGGFHRYSVDPYWRVPHFEKMLYDQAQLAVSFLETYLLTRERFFAEVAGEVLDYVRCDMTSSEGGFFSAEDADSALDPSRPEEKQEGVFYMWERGEMEEILGADRAELVCTYYGVSAAGNTLNDPHGEFGNRNVLYVATDLEQAAERCGMSLEEARTALAAAERELSKVRAKRPRPHLDDKVLTAWNGLMLSAFARCYRTLGRPEDLAAARAAASFVKSRLWDPERGLMRRFREGEARFSAQLDDYACLIQGLLDLYEAEFDVDWLEWAAVLQERQLELFSDPEAGTLYDDVEDPSLLVRSKDLYDGAEPSGNATSALNLLRLSWALDRPEWREKAEQIVLGAGAFLERAPHAVPKMLVALDFLLSDPIQLVIAGPARGRETQALLDVAGQRLLPHAVVLLADGGESQERLQEHLPFLEEMAADSSEKARAWVCHHYACELPVSDESGLREALDRAGVHSR